MTDAVYRIVEHDGGWAYKLGDVFSETFPDRQTAEIVAKRVTLEQRIPGEDEAISWEDERGIWHDEAAHGGDRPNAYVADAGASQRPAPDQQPHLMEQGGADPRAADYLRSAIATDRPAGGLELARVGAQSGSVVVMLLTIAFAYLLGIIVGRNT